MNSSDLAIRQNARSFVIFSLVGLSNTLIDYLVFFLLYHWFSAYYLLAQVISYSCGAVNSYLLNKYWTFQKKNVPTGAEILRFIIINVLVLAVSSLSLYVVTKNFSFNMFICKTIATGSSFAVNYIGNKFWVFK
ncbi:GtrA family protein [Desulfotomaculum nigrificans CO-1-SRB]|uniref:GtrA family protein n=1 Tax=Desulfotomaculum nigrificans (strain DSM 14880 / VKM B-2319 / CO-1-SRB) TaxID=868595 RepID=F6B8Z4_DESCC|nr:GtrA family protein [Desulfotomaculum nigrificans]AEF93645.1 GtrA family protein [Desulfotomaculum nigrificans CO-1-SRB]